MLAANPGHRATVLVAFASTAGRPKNSRTGKEIKLPPPATALSVPAIAAATNSRMAWLKCKLILLSEKPRSREGLAGQPQSEDHGPMWTEGWLRPTGARVGISRDSSRRARARAYCTEHSLEIVLIELTVMVTGLAEPTLVMESELVLMEGDSSPVTSTRWPM